MLLHFSSILLQSRLKQVCLSLPMTLYLAENSHQKEFFTRSTGGCCFMVIPDPLCNDTTVYDYKKLRGAVWGGGEMKKRAKYLLSLKTVIAKNSTTFKVI